MRKSHIGKGLLVLLLASICIFGFVGSRKEDTPKSASVKSQLIDPEDMVEGGYYLLWDHGSGVTVAQHDRVENGNVYSKYSIKPSQSLFAQNSSCTVYDAGNITLAGLSDILHLLRCILAGVFVP